MDEAARMVPPGGTSVVDPVWPIDSPAFREQYQTWVSDPATGSYLMDVFREPHDGDTWIGAL